MEALCRRDVGRDAVGNRSGAFILGALADLATVAVMGGQRQVGVEVSLAEVERSMGVFEDLMGRGRRKFVKIWKLLCHASILDFGLFTFRLRV